MFRRNRNGSGEEDSRLFKYLVILGTMKAPRQQILKIHTPHKWFCGGGVTLYFIFIIELYFGILGGNAISIGFFSRNNSVFIYKTADNAP